MRKLWQINGGEFFKMKTQDYLVRGLFDGLMQAKKEQEEGENMNDQNIFTEDEKAILKSLPKNYKWIARDKNGSIYVYADKPQRGELVFECQDCSYKLSSCRNISLFKHIFKGVTWENSPICFRPPILDKVERRYLKTVFRPFHKKIISVYKQLTNDEMRECLFANLEPLANFGDYMAFPMFEAGTMYKNMELNKNYTLEELGIKYD